MQSVHTQNQAHRFLHRMGHSLVSEPQGNLWMYGGLSLSEGILGNVYRYSHIRRSLFWISFLWWTSFCFCIHGISIHFVVGFFRYSVSERRWTQMLTSALEEGSTPSPRYHHASSLLAHESGSGNHGTSHSFMLVVGGVTQNGVSADTWSLNLSNLIWREHPVSVRFIIPAQKSFFHCQQM